MPIPKKLSRSALFVPLAVALSIIIVLVAYYSVDRIEEPDAYTKEGYCIVNTIEQMVLGLNRFETEKEFAEKCRGKMIFEFEQYRCTTFVSYEMRFPILLIDQNSTYLLDVNSSQKVCGKTVVEALVQ